MPEPDLGHSPTIPTTPETLKTLSAESNGCLDQSPAEGLRGSSLGASAEPFALAGASVGNEPTVRGEQFQGSRGDLQGQGSDARQRGGAPFLVLEGTSHTRGEGWTLRDEPCPLASWVNAHDQTGEVYGPATCKNARCRRCSRMVSARTFALARSAMADLPKGNRVRFMTLTRAPETWEGTRKRMQDLAQYLRRQEIGLDWLWVVERGERTGMKHVHAVQWGPEKIPWEQLLDWWGHRVEVQAARAATDYLGKNVVRYLGKGLDGEGQDIEAHMNLNGGRAAHWSRGFYAGMSRKGFAAAHPWDELEHLGRHYVEGQR